MPGAFERVVVLCLCLALLVDGTEDYVDADGVGPHGSGPGGPGYNVNIGDSLRELNQKQLAARGTYRSPRVDDQCAVQVR